MSFKADTAESPARQAEVIQLMREQGVAVLIDVMGPGERAAQTVFRMIETGRGSTEDHMGAVHLAVRESCDGPVAELAERRA